MIHGSLTHLMLLGTLATVIGPIAAVIVPLILKFGLLTTVLGWLALKTGPLFDKLVDWTKIHVKNKALAHVLVWGEHLAENVVLRLEVDLRPMLKTIEDTGKLDPDAAKKLKAIAIGDFKDLAGPTALDFVHSVLGVDNAALDAWISGLLEKAVGNLNSAKASAAVSLARAAESAGTAQMANMLQSVASHAVASGLLGEPPPTNLALVKPITSAPSAQPTPEPKVDLPTDKQLDDAKAAAPQTVTLPSP